MSKELWNGIAEKAATEIKRLIIDQRKWGKDQILSFFLTFDKF